VSANLKKSQSPGTKKRDINGSNRKNNYSSGTGPTKILEILIREEEPPQPSQKNNSANSPSWSETHDRNLDDIFTVQER